MSVSVSICKSDKMYYLELLQHGNRCICDQLYKWNQKFFFVTLERYEVNNTECNIDCYGNRGEKCGGIRTYSIYIIVEGKLTKWKDTVKKGNLNVLNISAFDFKFSLQFSCTLSEND